MTREEHSFDVTKLVKASGKHTVTLLYDKGAHAIEIESVALYENSPGSLGTPMRAGAAPIRKISSTF